MKKSKPQVDLNDLYHTQRLKGLVISGVPCPQNKQTGEIHPHVTQFKVLGKHNETVSVFHVKPIYYEHATSTDDELIFRPLYEVCEHYGNHQIVFKYEKLTEVHPRYLEWLRKRMKIMNGQVLVTSPFSESLKEFGFFHELMHNTLVRPTIGLTTTTVYPDPNPETNSYDGGFSNDKATWALAYDNTSPTVANDTNTAAEVNLNGSTIRVQRITMGFYTASIPDTDTISDATLTTTCQRNHLDASGTQSVRLVSHTSTSNTAITAADYAVANWGTSNYATADKLYTSITTPDTTDDWVFSSTGIAAINKTGVTQMGIRQVANDIANSAPSSGLSITIGIFLADNSGTTKDPKLVVNHVAGATIVTPAAQVATFSIPTYTVKRGSTLAAATQIAAFSVPTYSVKISKVLAANVQSAAFTVPVYSVLAGNTIISPAAQVAVLSVPAYSVKTGALIIPQSQVAMLSIPTYTVSAARNAIIAAAVQVLTFTLPTLVKVGGVWTKAPRTTTESSWSRTGASAASWTKRSVNDD